MWEMRRASARRGISNGWGGTNDLRKSDEAEEVSEKTRTKMSAEGETCTAHANSQVNFDKRK